MSDTQTPDSAARRRRNTGRLMVGVACVGVVVALIGTVVAWRLVGRLSDSSRETLTVTIDTIDSLEGSIELVDEVLGAATETIATASTTLDALVVSFDETTTVIDSLDELTEVVGPALGDAASTLRTLESVGEAIDGVLEDLSSIPFGPDYDAGDGLGPTIGSLAGDLEELPNAFDDASRDLDGFATALDELAASVTELSGNLRAVNEPLDGRDGLVERYRVNVADARAIAVGTRDGLDDDIGLMRLLLVIGGITFALGQVVPYSYGREQLRRVREADPIASST